MSSYRGTAELPDKAKAITAVVVVHVALAFVIFSGLAVPVVRHAVDRLTTVKITELPPPPPLRPPPRLVPVAQKAKKAEGTRARKAEASPVVAPEPKLPLPSPTTAAKVAGTGVESASGAAVSGNGTGAGSSGKGTGGGGDYTGFTPARRISKIPDREYRRLASTGLQSGSVGVTVRVNVDGSVSNCRIARSSGNPNADGLMCALTLDYIRFEPARDPSGRPVAQDVTFVPNWWRP